MGTDKLDRMCIFGKLLISALGTVKKGIFSKFTHYFGNFVQELMSFAKIGNIFSLPNIPTKTYNYEQNYIFITEKKFAVSLLW
jgi:hypothetical protein